ncbi:arsenic transporter [Aureimonas endophytica]|uniref:Arsenic transporter n=1 Tax=Aureimonas endophytica TaxID=2027858 RepID=A0A917E2T5_9HYPH|nr:arsenic transporter [Aureimonas endophytica]GGD97162.1 arsenic transporter [Aureimonas endophytica]
MSVLNSNDLTWAICALAVAGVILRPFSVPEWIFAVIGAALLPVLGLLPLREVGTGIASGTDVYLFLAGMMLLAEVARREGLFDYLAAHAARSAKGSPQRLFVLVYLIGTIVTVFLSNDATAVVLTPAVAAVARAASVATPVPYLLICAFVANAASFVLPISNPANLVVFGEDMPPLGEWLARFALPSLLAIVITFLALRWTQRNDLQGRTSSEIAIPTLSRGGRIAAAGLVVAALVLLLASGLGFDLGWPTALAGAATALAVVLGERSNPLALVKGVSWDTLLLVAGLFVIVRALELSGLQTLLTRSFEGPLNAAPQLGALIAGAVAAFGSNVTNNLPLGLVAGSFTTSAHLPGPVVDSILIGIDLGPNLSVTGSLATILWLSALRRENLSFGALRFLKLGLLIMPAALLPALAAVILQPWR